MFDSWLTQLFAKHAKTGIAIDANLLLVYTVGLVGAEHIPTQKRTREYTVEDFVLLRRVIQRFDYLVSTPKILTEVDNLSGMLRQDIRRTCRQLIRDQLLKVVEERYIASTEASGDAAFEQLGLSDASFAMLARAGMLVLTSDFDLSYILAARGADCINYTNVLRPLILAVD